MSEPLDKSSFLANAGTQTELIPLENLPDDIFDAEENPGVGEPRYTAERFFRKRPDDYRLCVTLIAARIGRLQIARLMKVHHMTVAAVEEREGVAIDIEKERIRKNIRLAVGNASERLPEIMANLPANQLPLATAILIDKLAQLDGEPTHRIEHTHKVQLTHEQLAAAITAFPEAAIDVQATTPVSTDSRAGDAAQKALPGPSSASAGSDTQSETSPS
jgi:hypothetical protein